jgi:hypothetical protein
MDQKGKDKPASIVLDGDIRTVPSPKIKVNCSWFNQKI